VRVLAALMMYFCTLNLLVQFSKPFLDASSNLQALYGSFELIVPLAVAIIVYRISP